MSLFTKVDSALYSSQPRPGDMRLGELVRFDIDPTKKAKPRTWTLLGYPDDEGVKLNRGRQGCAFGPHEIRKALYKLCPGKDDFPTIEDIGNLNVSLEADLRNRHTQAANFVSELYAAGRRVISLGGGHDWAYPDIYGFLKNNKDPCLVINIDAHLDVRPDNESPNSGTAFYRLLEEFDHFHLVEIGIHPFANSLSLFEYAQKKNVKVYDYMSSTGQLNEIFIELGANQPTFLSIDIDAFSSAFAPGASASMPIGLDPHEFVAQCPQIVKNFDLKGVGIYEVAPNLDVDARTSKLAGLIVHQILYHES